MRSINVKILSAKDITHYVLLEEMSDKYSKLEETLQSMHNLADVSAEQTDVGDFVVAFVRPNEANSNQRKQWCRARVDNIYNSIASLLYSLYLMDYGVRKCVPKQFVRPLKPHLSHVFVPYRVIHLRLSGVTPLNNSPTAVNTVVDMLNTRLEMPMTATVESRDVVKSIVTISGNVWFEGGDDLRSYLVEQGFADLTEDAVMLDMRGVSFSSKAKSSESCADKAIRLPTRSPFQTNGGNHSFQYAINNTPINNSPHEALNNLSIASSSSSKSLDTNNERKKLSDTLKKLNLNKESDEEVCNELSETSLSSFSSSSSNTCDETNGVEKEEESEVSEENKESEESEPIDWPVSHSRRHLNLKPAGCQPMITFAKYRKFYTLD